MKPLFVVLTALTLFGCAKNPVANSQMLASTPLYDTLFIASTSNTPDKVEFRSLAVMYENKAPIKFMPNELLFCI